MKKTRKYIKIFGGYIGFVLTFLALELQVIAEKSNEVAAGEALELRNGEVSIVLPKGWKHFTGIPGQTLLATAPEADRFGFQRAIQIMTFGGPKFLDEVTAMEYREIISRRFSGASAAISQYQMNNHLKIEMADGRAGILFYSSFENDGRKFMQAHILVSNLERHFVISYTDAAEHFASDAPTPNLNEAWQTLVSTKIKGPTPLRYGGFYKMGGMVAVFVMSVIMWIVYRKWAARRYENEIKLEFSADLNTEQNSLKRASGPQASLDSGISSEHGDGDDDEHYSKAAGITVDSHSEQPLEDPSKRSRRRGEMVSGNPKKTRKGEIAG